MTPFSELISPENIGEIIDFTVPDKKDTESMATLQRQGVAALYNILCKGSVAYLADEVGTGKTYQALGLAALTWHLKPDAKILFITPRQNLQDKWIDDYHRFFSSNYRRNQGIGDDRVTSVLFHEPTHRAVKFDNLRNWSLAIGRPERVAPFLRHSSFTRPVFIRSEDLKGDMGQLWRQWQTNFKGWGLTGNASRPPKLVSGNASEKLNLTFAALVNEKLSQANLSDAAYFDLVIVDEAQCLRNPDNQTNTVLYEVLKSQVDKWLFMSATPAHSGPKDIPTILNRYPNCGTILEEELVEDLPELQRSLSDVMVRRQRRYQTKSPNEMLSKSEYRIHDLTRWQVTDKDMSTMSTLAMGLVQKGLVEVLGCRNNRYRIGFLSSFESLQSSIRSEGTKVKSDESDPETEGEKTDFTEDSFTDRNERNAPDADFIHELGEDFEKKFGMHLPHAKVNSIVDRIAPLAFGSEDEVGGKKFLIFTRRVSTVSTLRDQLVKRHREAVKARIDRYWMSGKKEFDWQPMGNQKDDEDFGEEHAEDEEAMPVPEDGDPLLKTLSDSEEGWLFRYRRTFGPGGSNTLFFEDGWLERLCRAGGVDPMVAAERMCDEIWQESWNHAQRGGKQYRGDRLRYIAAQCIKRCPEIFGLTKETAEPWRAAYEICLRNQQAKSSADGDHRHDPDLFNWPSLWTKWDQTFTDSPVALPASIPSTIRGTDGRDELCRRQIARTIIGQIFRLTDTLLDLYFADAQEGKPENLASNFIEFLESQDPGARQLKNDCEHWISHLRLIVDSCLDGTGLPWHELAGRESESWKQLYQLMPVVGITGGTGGNLTPIRQFRTPSYPRVVVCTDTLKEGVDLHLFCDTILHYGVAWTSGDMEQRIGRVDRYFSQIERRLADDESPHDVKLNVGYPHIVASLERGQVERVINRQREAERLMDSPLYGKGKQDTDTNVDAGAEETKGQIVQEPFGQPCFPSRSRSLLDVTDDIDYVKNHYFEWYERFLSQLKTSDWVIKSDGSMVGDKHQPVRNSTLVHTSSDTQGTQSESQHEIEWRLDAALQRYVVTLSSDEGSTHDQFSGGERLHIVSNKRVIQSFVRLLVPTPDEGPDDPVIESLLNVLSGNPPIPMADTEEFWGDTFSTLSPDDVDWWSHNQATLRVQRERGSRAHDLTVSAFEGSIRAIGVVSSSLDRIRIPDLWSRAPSVEEARRWVRETNNQLPLGYLEVDEHDGLIFGIHALHGNMSPEGKRRLLEQVAWRADAWEASLTGEDIA